MKVNIFVVVEKSLFNMVCIRCFVDEFWDCFFFVNNCNFYVNCFSVIYCNYDFENLSCYDWIEMLKLVVSNWFMWSWFIFEFIKVLDILLLIYEWFCEYFLFICVLLWIFGWIVDIIDFEGIVRVKDYGL